MTGNEQEPSPEAFKPYLAFAGAVGRRLGELHEVLSRPSDNPDFSPEPVDGDVLTAWADGAIEQMDGAFALLRAIRDWPDEATGTLAKTLLEREPELHERVHRLAVQGAGSTRTRVHGDFHLGQVLVVQNDAFIIDFEGEPARPMSQRRMKGSPLRDVAGLLRSFDYAAAAAAPGRTAASAQTAERRLALLEHFRDVASSAFLACYREVLAETPNPWVPPEAEAALLDLFLIEKAAYEIRYEAANRPTWLGIPMAGLLRIADRLAARAEPALA